jgi:hypothetical protein
MFVAMLERAADERFGEQADLGFVGGGRRQFDLLAPGGRPFVIGNGGGALRVPEFIERPLEILRVDSDRAETGIAPRVRGLRVVCP